MVVDGPNFQVERLGLLQVGVTGEGRGGFDGADGVGADDLPLDGFGIFGCVGGCVCEEGGLRLRAGVDFGAEDSSGDPGHEERGEGDAKGLACGEFGGCGGQQDAEQGEWRGLVEDFGEQDSDGEAAGGVEGRGVVEVQRRKSMRGPADGRRCADGWRWRLRRRDGGGGHRFARPPATELATGYLRASAETLSRWKVWGNMSTIVIVWRS